MWGLRLLIEDAEPCVIQPCKGSASYGADYYPELRLCNRHYNLLVAGRLLSWKRLEPDWKPRPEPGTGHISKSYDPEYMRRVDRTIRAMHDLPPPKETCALCRPASSYGEFIETPPCPRHNPLVRSDTVALAWIVVGVLLFIILLFFLQDIP